MVHKGMKAVSDKLASVQSIMATNSQHVQELMLMFKDMVFHLEVEEAFKKANAEGEKWEKNNPKTPTEEKDAQNPDQTQGEQHLGDVTMANAQGEQPPTQELSNVNTLEKKVTDDEPPVKKLKFLIPTSSSSIPSPTPLNSIMHEPLQKPDASKMIIKQYTKYLNKTTSSIFSPTSPRETTPPKDESKGKGIATEEPLKEIMPYMEESGSVLKIPSLKSFFIPGGS
ncbi:hypothetical protein Tco_0056731 [Tanacetum coccineum]